MVIEDEYGYADEEDYDDVATTAEPKWRTLSPNERKELMANVFSDPNWYEGNPVFDGGDANPMFDVIAEKAEAPLREVRRYYAAWLKRQGFSPTNIMKPKENPLGESSVAATSPSYVASPFSAPVETSAAPIMPAPPESANSEATSMWSMMNFLTAQQQMAMQNQQFQMQIAMEQRRLDQTRESELRRESVARDQQFMNQQMAFMRDMTKKSGDDGFFDTEMKGMFKERMVDNMFGEKDEGWKESIKDVLGSDTMKAAVGGLGGALAGATRKSVPAGYDQPDYNPYAQAQMVTQLPQEVPQQVPQQVPPGIPITTPQPQPPTNLDGVFFEEQGEVQPPTQVPTTVAPQEPQQPQQITHLTEDEYKKILFGAFVEAMGPVANDQQVLAALQEQIDVAVSTTLIEIPEALPQPKLQRMNEKLLLIRNLRDIGMGMMDLRERTTPGEAPSDLIVAAGVAELRGNPEFYNIFADNTYDELMAKIEPFKTTGAVEQDYLYLQKPEVQEVCRYLLQAVKNDALQNGVPQIPTLA
jgi:hypothetical protein